MSSCAYDTAWVARLTRPEAPEEPLFPASFDWLLRNQHPDGSWGADIAFAHDRVISTLSALVALAGSQHRRNEAQRAVRRGVVYLNRERPDLQADPAETVGFELILPELVRQAKALGLRLPYRDWEFVEAIKADKLRRIPPIAIYGGPTPMTHSLEFLGDRLAHMLVQRCQSPNGSYGASPSATAYVQAQLKDNDALGYIYRVAEQDSGGIPYVYPFETMETSFVLYFLEPALHGLPEAEALIDRLADTWSPMGTPWSRECSVPDADDTAVTLSVLVRYGRSMDADVFELFEANEYFHTFAFERNPSVTTNAHILHVLRQYPSVPERRRVILKIVHYLTRTRTKEGFWHDKWHASPYYATGEAIQALSGISTELVRRASDGCLAPNMIKVLGIHRRHTR
jgi:halimadienyl-diphosphate synthase